MNTTKTLLWGTFLVGALHTSSSTCMSTKAFLHNTQILDNHHNWLLQQTYPLDHPIFAAVKKLKHEAWYLRRQNHIGNDLNTQTNEKIFTQRLNRVLSGQYNGIVESGSDTSGPEQLVVPTIKHFLGNRISRPTADQVARRRAKTPFAQEQIVILRENRDFRVK